MKLIRIFTFLTLLAAGVKVTAHEADSMTPEQRIDFLIHAKLKEQNLMPNAPLDDAGFVRRVYLGIIGRIPTIEEAEAFHGSKHENKRERLIDQLLNSDGCVSHGYNFWADVLRINAGLGIGATLSEFGYQLWLKQALKENMPYDQMVRELVGARGNVWENGATGYYQRDRGMPLENMSNTVRIFLGVRLECAQCHNHPFDKWTQMDYYKMAAFSYGMGLGTYRGPNQSAMEAKMRDDRIGVYQKAVGIEDFPMFAREEDFQSYLQKRKDRDQLDAILAGWGLTEDEAVARLKAGLAALKDFDEVSVKVRSAETQLYREVRYLSISESKRDLKLPHDYQYADAKPLDVVSARTMFGADIDLERVAAGESVIDKYAAWMTSKENPTFSRVIANRIWKSVFGVGVFEPVDEINDLTAVSNPELMDYLEQLMKELNFDLKAYQKILYNTDAFQRVASNEELDLGAPYYFQGPILRRMSAEQVWDSIVGLALPEADSYRPRLRNQLASIDRARLIHESLEELSSEEYIAIVTRIRDMIPVIRSKQEKVREELVMARDAKNDALYQAKRSEMSALEREIYQTVTELGHKKLREPVSADDLLAAAGMSETKMSGAISVVLTSLPKPNMPEAPSGLDEKQLKKWKKEQDDHLKIYTDLVGKMARASELESPARRGHFLREFGQSDREVIENAADNASVPQALNLLNGPAVETLTNKFSVLGSRIHGAGAPEEKTKLIFQAMLTREPTQEEMTLALAEIGQYGDEAYTGLVWALLNTQQFLFVR